MKYNHIVEGRFIERPNRFIAYVDIAGERTKVHVKNTGRCKELLVPGAKVYLEKSNQPNRSTGYDLITVEKEGRLINMDSNAPNQAVKEWLEKGALFEDIKLIRPETTYGQSRFDFYLETEKQKIFIEVKGVTLEYDNHVFFPDAPSDRAVKHVEELIAAHKEGYECYILFVIQMRAVKDFAPNETTHKAFAEALRKAHRAGVHIIARDCQITVDSMEIMNDVEVKLHPLADTITPLLTWYDKGHRELPWRSDPTPYHVWLSEIMLQQTRVEAVKGYYHRFLEALPDIQALANAPEDLLLKLWEGLGYYNRVRNLQKAAIQIMDLYQGEMPADYVLLQKLAGIGSYTAGAIGSIAFDLPVPAVDGNVLRVLSRLRMDERDIADMKTKKLVEEELQEIMPAKRSGDYNQALMELGATVCVPNGVPHCNLCPFVHICKAHLEARELDFPVKAAKKERKIEKMTVLIIKDGERLALHKRENRGLLAGLYELPNIAGHQSKKRVISYLKELGLEALHIKEVGAAKHIFTHKEWHMIGYQISVDQLSHMMKTGEAKDYLFVEPQAVKEHYAIPSAFAAYTSLIDGV